MTRSIPRLSAFGFWLSALLLIVPATLSAQNTWKGRDGDWADPKNWSKNSVPSLKIEAPAEKKPATNKKPSTVKPSAPTPPPATTAPKTTAPGAAATANAGPKAPALPPVTTPATPNAIILGGGTATWDTTLGDFALEVPMLMTKKAGWKQTNRPSWIFVRNGGSLTVNDAAFDGGTSNNFIVGGDNAGHVLITGKDAVFTMPTGEIKMRRNATFTVQDGKVTAKLVSFDDAAQGTHGVLTLVGGTLTLEGNAYGCVYGGGDHHYINFPVGSKAVIYFTNAETDAVFEKLEKGNIRFNGLPNLNAFKVEPREGSGTKLTLDPDAKP